MSEDDIKRLQKRIKVLYILIGSVVVWLAYACCCHLKFGTDGSAGVFITALGVLVTLLVAWQIYMTIVSKEEVSRMSEELNSIRNEHQRANRQNRNITMGWHRLTMGDVSLDDDSYVEAYCQYIQALKLFIDSPLSLDDELVENCLASMAACVDSVEDAQNERQINIKNKFINNNPKFDNENEELLNLVKKRERANRNFKKQLIYLKERRGKLECCKSAPFSQSCNDEDYMTMEELDAVLDQKLNERESNKNPTSSEQ